MKKPEEKSANELNLDKELRDSIKLRQAREAVQLADHQAILKSNRDLIRAGQLELLEDREARAVAKNETEDDQGIQIGDNVTHVTNTPSEKPTDGVSTIAKIATVGALLGTGAGVGVPAGMLVLDALRDPPAAVQPAPMDPVPPVIKDSDTKFQLEALP